jgi:hypothetical protein
MKNLIIAVLFIIFGVWGCSSDNPVNPPAVPAYVGVYQGTTSVGDSVSFTVSNVNGTAFVTSYFLSYSLYSSGTSTNGTKRETKSEGIAKVNNNAFEISLGTPTDENFTGTFSDDTKLNGTYKFQETISPVTYVHGSFSLNK